jgi:hypothetical protein
MKKMVQSLEQNPEQQDPRIKVRSYKCRRCHRPLKNPAAIERGMGSVCWSRYASDHYQKDQGLFTQNSIPFEGDIICQRTEGGIKTNVPQQIIQHSPDGFEWGYGGSGPADFALNILLLFTNEETARRLHQVFKWRFVATLPREGGIIKGNEIRAWLDVEQALLT